jgi:protein-S-isoprenylcysteine O-methyltransferase Ste14
MTLQNILSLSLFTLFEILVLTRAAILRQHRVRVIVFGQTDKYVYLFILSTVLIACAAAASTFGVLIWSSLIHPFWTSQAPGWIGLLLCFISTIGFLLTLISFGNSFRVGIDGNAPGKLITTGMFAISRNPVYVCMMILFAGLFLIHNNIAVTAAILLFVPVLHRQILREERFLASHYGDEYSEYLKKTRRYL